MFVGRPMVVRRRPLLRAAAVGGTYAAGRASGRRAEEQAQYQQAAQNQPAEDQASMAQGQPAADQSVTDQLNQLAGLYQQGALSADEFAAAKAKILGGT